MSNKVQYLSPEFSDSPLVKWVGKFMQSHQLFPNSGKSLVGVSGGADSMLLLTVLNALKKYNPQLFDLEVIHFDHGTRTCNKKERELVEGHSHLLGIKCNSFELNLDINSSNFEALARDARLKIFKQIARKEGRIIYLGHHIDDSIEWSLMQQLKSSSLRPSLGIPLTNGSIYRPFHCLTRSQIRRLGRQYKIPFMDDATNDSMRFERNFVRKELLSRSKVRFPQYQKHFVHRHNLLAQKLGVHRHLKSNQDEFKLIRFGRDSVAIYSLNKQNDFKNAKEIIRRTLESLSSKNKGKLSLQIEKLIEAQSNYKKGPMNFSGGVRVYIDRTFLLFVSAKREEKGEMQSLKKSALVAARKLSEKSFSSI